jgi:hypothetical protein
MIDPRIGYFLPDFPVPVACPRSAVEVIFTFPSCIAGLLLQPFMQKKERMNKHGDRSFMVSPG